MKRVCAIACVAWNLAGAGVEAQSLVASAELTADGRWFTYLLTPESSDGKDSQEETVAVLRSTVDETERRYVAGDASLGAGILKTAGSGGWIGFMTAAGAQQSGATAHTGLALVEAASGRRRDFPGVRNFRFVGEPGREWLVLEGYPQEGQDTFDLTLLRLGSGQPLALSVTRDFIFDPTAARLAWCGPRGLQVHELSSGRTLTLDGASVYRNITWSPGGRALAALRTVDSQIDVAVFSAVNTRAPKRKFFAPREWKGFPAEYEISTDALNAPTYQPRAVLTWRQDEKGLFFGIRPKPQVKKLPERIVPKLALWHWRDNHAPAAKGWVEAEERQFSYLSYLSLTDGNFVRLADESLKNVLPHARGNGLLGYDTRAYDRLSNVGFSSRDYYVVDLLSARRTLLAAGLKGLSSAEISYFPFLSPDGRTVVYQQNGDYFSFVPASGARRNITAGLPTQFYYEENQRNTQLAKSFDGWLNVVMWQGWSMDGTYVLISDSRDVWALPLREGTAMNLTGNGRRDDVVYTRTRFGDSQEYRRLQNEAVDLGKPVYFTVKEFRTGRTGLAVKTPGQPLARILQFEDAALEYRKAGLADVYLLSRFTSSEPAVYSIAGADWRAANRLLDTATVSRKASTPGRYLTYTTSRGDIRSATLFPPSDYVPGKSYPAIVQIYEQQGRPHSSWKEEGESQYAQSIFHNRGYALLLPDIQPRTNEAGSAAVECVTAAVEAAVATGIVDRDRVGLTGHSMGGYETMFIVSQTDLFKAAVAEGGMANLWSLYGYVWPIGIFHGPLMEGFQPYLGGPWWEHWEAFLKNSPLYHARSIHTPLLIVHGDQDPWTPFQNVVELYYTLHRLGDKPVVMLEYKGEEHNSIHEGEVGKDVFARTVQFFDHFLKDAPAPDWWADGVSIPAGEAPAP